MSKVTNRDEFRGSQPARHRGNDKSRPFKDSRKRPPNETTEGDDKRSIDFSKTPGAEPRAAAVDLLYITDSGASRDEAVDSSARFNALEGADRAFARAIASTTLRRRGAIDSLIADHLDRPFPKRSKRALHVLRATAAQIVFLDVAPHAAVSTAVAICKAYRETAALAGVVNAISRRITETGKARVDGMPLRIDTAGWLWRSWERAYGPPTTRAIAKAHANQAPIDLTIKDPARFSEFLERTGGKAIGDRTIRIADNTQVPDLPGYANGDWWVQDAASLSSGT